MHYSLICSNINKDTEGFLSVYGIEYNDGEKNIIIEDITTEYKRLERLVSLCNELKLDALHIREVVEDFLSE